MKQYRECIPDFQQGVFLVEGYMEEVKMREIFDAIARSYHGLKELDVAVIYYNKAVGTSHRKVDHILHRA